MARHWAYLEGAGAFTPQMHQLKDAEDGARPRIWNDEGATSFKAYMHIRPDELAAVVKAAHRAGNQKSPDILCSIGFREAASLGNR